MLQIGKYLIFLFFSFVALFFLRFRIKSASQLLYTASTLLFVLYVTIKGIVVGEIEFLEIAFAPAVSLIIVLATKNVRFDSLQFFLKFLLFFSLGVNFLQIALFFLIGRLPALAYSDSYSVRFGSFLDDPNGFAALCFLLIGWVYFSNLKNRRLILLGLIVSLLVTQSLTAIGFLILISFFILFFGGNFARASLVFSCLLLATLVLIFWEQILPIADYLISSKSQSIEEHLNHENVGFDLSILSILIGSNDILFVESGWTYLFLNFGIVGLSLFSTMMITLLFSLKKYIKTSRDVKEKAILWGLIIYCLYFIIGMLNLPFVKVFPINIVFFLISTSVVFLRIESVISGGNPPIFKRA
ncbi:hypothetical protein D3878_11045 [Noviherbaspirillum sedimenti]|uniref:Uncharacterized protein n=1 Tax=Noviherbaspirillum sedimenti TaxID=2320865 RepID=A0A3A3GID9_9BURK|nr:hypothetical protein D3878_11045 [Noviherbaspirillum sedimenti]